MTFFYKFTVELKVKELVSIWQSYRQEYSSQWSGFLHHCTTVEPKYCQITLMQYQIILYQLSTHSEIQLAKSHVQHA